MRNFTRAEWDLYAGAEPFRDNEDPTIHTLKSGLDIIADGTGVTLAGSVGTVTIGFNLYGTRSGKKSQVESAAQAWIEELEPLTKYEQLALLNNIGLKNMAG